MTPILGNQSRRHDITFRFDGTISIKARPARQLALMPGDAIDIAKDPLTGDFYLFVAARADAAEGRSARVAPVNHGPRQPHYLRAYSTSLARTVIKACKPPHFFILEAEVRTGQPTDIPPYGTALPLLTLQAQQRYAAEAKALLPISPVNSR